jgi:hypothetical protein
VQQNVREYVAWMRQQQTTDEFLREADPIRRSRVWCGRRDHGLQDYETTDYGTEDQGPRTMDHGLGEMLKS